MNYLTVLTEAITIAGELEVDNAILQAGQGVTFPAIITIEGHKFQVALVPVPAAPAA